MQTPEDEYVLIFQGQVQEGWDVAEVKARFTALMRCDPEKTEAFFSGSKQIFRRFTSKDAAKKTADRLRQIGMVVGVRTAAPRSAPLPAAASSPAPPPPAAPPSPAQAADASEPAAPIPPEHGAEGHKRRAIADIDDAPVPPERWAEARPGTQDRREAFVFNGNGSEFFKIWIVNVFLSILTLGIYSAWAKVRTLRYFYGNTLLGGSAFEYLAEPMKILKGRLIVVAFSVVFSVAARFYPGLNVLFGLVIFALSPWIIRQALRFRCHYTAWRGVRFSFAGNLSDAFRAFVLWPMAAVLPFFLPISWHRQTHYLADNARYGAASFENHSMVNNFFGVYGRLLVVGLVFIFGGGLLISSVPRFAGLFDSLNIPPAFTSTICQILLFFVAWTCLGAIYKVEMTNLRIGKTAIGPHRLISTYAWGSYLKLVLTNTFAVIFTLGFFFPFAKVRTARYAAEHTAMIVSGDLDGFVADQQAEVSALGGEAGEFFDVDIGF